MCSAVIFRILLKGTEVSVPRATLAGRGAGRAGAGALAAGRAGAASGAADVGVSTGAGLDPRLSDTDPQHTGVAPLVAEALDPEAKWTADLIAEVDAQVRRLLADDPQANVVLFDRALASLVIETLDKLAKS